MKHKHKLTPQDYKIIVERAAKLPQLVRIKPDGTYMSRQVTKTLLGKDLPKETKIEGKILEPNKLYVQRISEPLYVNHQTEMIQAFWKSGPQGVINYIKSVEAIVERSKPAAA